MDLKFKYFWLDWIRMSSFYVLYSAEYAITLLLAFATIPYVKKESFWPMPNTLNFNVDMTLIYFVLICLSVPNFISTWVYLHQKRSQQLYYCYGGVNSSKLH